ncbi:MAG: ATP-binding protein [Nanoarchaeota archaeon]
MPNIHFIGREEEIALLNKLSRESFFLIVKGRRRIGKTSLLRKAFPDAIYIFIWPDKSIDWILEQISLEYSLPKFKNFGSLLEYLFEKNKIVIIDEFQNFLNVDKSIYGEVQKVIDGMKQSGSIFKLAIAGSSYSLMNKVFYDSASPLYGRKTHEINLGNLDVNSLFKNLNISLEEFIEMWAVFEGVPYYYELMDLEKIAKENIFDLVLSSNSQLKEEGKAILSVEFGKDSRTYNTVLTAISEGKTKLNEIASLFDNKKNEVVKYLDMLRKDFNLVRKITPLTENPQKSRIGKYEINDNFLSFWFYFYDKNRSYIEQERFDELRKFFNEQFNSYLGRKFEKFIIELIKNKKILSEFNFKSIGNQWGKCEKGTYEIDIMAINAKEEVLFGECKWSEGVNVLKILNELNEKTQGVDYERKLEKEIFVVFAKSFSNKINEFEGRKVYCFDLKDLGRALKKT